MQLISQNGNTKLCQGIVLSMDRQWLKQNIWFYSAPIFDDQNYQSFGIFMYLFKAISDDLSKKLANLALTSGDEDVRDIGEMYFSESSQPNHKDDT